MAKQKYTSVDIEAQAIKIVQDERTRWFDAVSFVTDRVAFQMRNLIRNLRKNYWGVFDIPLDPMTNRQKVWIPLTRTLVEGVVKNIDLDAKDINFRSKSPKGYAITGVIRALVHDYLEKHFFGETLDEMERTLAIDGTVVWKIIEGKDANGKPEVIRRNVDLLNVYIDPTEDDIQSAFRFTERSLMLPDEIEAMDGWTNTDDLIGSKMISRIDGQYTTITTGSTAHYRDVWEMWGKIPKSLISGKKEKDDAGNYMDDDYIDGHIVVSGLEMNDPKCHLVEENVKHMKPYEECRYAKVSNRWYGLGVAERVLMLQIWLNTIVNIRINRSYISQLGLFKIRKGSGITPQMLSRLGANGAIVVNDPSDIEQFQVDEASESSYKDEERIMDWAQRDTNAYDVSVGEPTPASKPATTSVIENNSAKSGFTMVKEEIGIFLQRVFDRHMLPIIASTVSKDDLIRVSTSHDAIHTIVDAIVAHDANNELERLYTMGVVPTPEKLKQAMDEAKKKILGRDNVFIKQAEKLISEHVDTEVFITNEDMDVSVTIQNLLQMIPLVPEAKMQLVSEAMDLMGLDVEIPQQPTQQAPQQKVSQTINFKDLPPEGRAQMAAEAGIKLSPQQQPPTGSVTPQGQGLMSALQGGNNPQQIATKAMTMPPQMAPSGV